MLLTHWTGDDLSLVGESNRYAEGRVAALARAKDGIWTFNPLTDRDHFATPYIPIPSTEPERWAGIQVKPSPGARPNCILHVQNHKFENIGSVPCGEDSANRELPVFIAVPPSATSIRMYVADANLAPIVLPREISVTLYAGDGTPPAAASQK